ncbi:MAG: hypothetical protein JWM57_1314, partial [Phycisphaerales bacterium]|nr:hypothetical protein [Phycisphaerales bacterium]
SNAPFPWVRIIFPLFGVLFVIGGIVGVAAGAVNTGPVNPLSVADGRQTQTRPDTPATVAVKGGSLIHCSQCGEPRRVGGQFCSRCGLPVNGA